MSALRQADAFQPVAQRLHWDPVRFRAVSLEPIYAEPQPVRIPELPEAGPWVERMARACVECLLGLRPTHQLIRWLAPGVFEALAARVSANAQQAKPKGIQAIRAREANIYEVDDRTREANCTVFDGTRFRACAMRVREHRGRWLIVALEIG